MKFTVFQFSVKSAYLIMIYDQVNLFTYFRSCVTFIRITNNTKMVGRSEMEKKKNHNKNENKQKQKLNYAREKDSILFITMTIIQKDLFFVSFFVHAL